MLLISFAILVTSCTDNAQNETCSIQVCVRLAEGASLQPTVYATCVSMKNNLPVMFHTLLKVESHEPGIALFNGENLKPGTYRIKTGWTDYSYANDNGNPVFGPLPTAEKDIVLSPGPRSIEMEILYNTGVILYAQNLPDDLAHKVRVTVTDKGGSYRCSLGRLPIYVDKQRNGFFLPLSLDSAYSIQAEGIVPGWSAKFETASSTPPKRQQLEFPERSYGQLKVGIFYPSGLPVAGFCKAQLISWDMPFEDPHAAIEMTNVGKGYREAGILLNGVYRLFFTWNNQKDHSQGCEDICSIKVNGSVSHRILFDPAVVVFRKENIPHGDYTVSIREKESSRLVSKRFFSLPTKAEVYCMIFRPGIYVAEMIMCDSPRMRKSSPFRIISNERQTISFE